MWTGTLVGCAAGAAQCPVPALQREVKELLRISKKSMSEEASSHLHGKEEG